MSTGIKAMDDLRYLNELFAEIEARRGASPDSSYSAQLLADLPRAARKLGEEAVETLTAALSGDEEELLAESENKARPTPLALWIWTSFFMVMR